MKPPVTLHIAAVLFASVALIAVGSAHQGHMSKSKTKTKGIPYAKVAPLIQSNCMPCHNAKSHPEKVDLSSFASLMKSGEKGSIVVAGHPEKSKLIMYVDGTKKPRMPFKKAPLSAKDIQSLRAWVAAGAKG
ncbi:MAG: hypothetical protein P4L46_09995 [Fimbriimonas sp.]|nr:hypothetical protein [Fimbriimonas sp.]